MSLFDDVSRFLENRLDEFLRNHPHLELQALEEQLREQEDDTLRLIRDAQNKEKELQSQILSTAQDIQRWHERISKAKANGREDLAKSAQEREAALLRQGNQLWGQMQATKERIEKGKELYRQIHARRLEVQKKAAEAQATAASNPTSYTDNPNSWNPSYKFNANSSADPLEDTFRRWEMDEDLEQMKRNMGR
jgi:uncharacterized protein (TIGR04376 family)